MHPLTRLLEGHAPWMEEHAGHWWYRTRDPDHARAIRLLKLDASASSAWDDILRFMQDAELMDRVVGIVGSWGALHRLSEALLLDLRAMEAAWPQYVEKGIAPAGGTLHQALKVALGEAEDLAEDAELPKPKPGAPNPFFRVTGLPLPADRPDLADRVGAMRDEVVPKLLEAAIVARGMYPGAQTKAPGVAAALKKLYDALKHSSTSEDRAMSTEAMNEMRRLAGITEMPAVHQRVLNRLHENRRSRPRPQVEMLSGKIDPRSAAFLDAVTHGVESTRATLMDLYKTASDLAAIEPGEPDGVKALILAAIDKLTEASAKIERLNLAARTPA